MFRKVLVANRGEIALRIIRTCRELGVSTVAVYSEADRDSSAVEAADEAICIGPAAARRSYLLIPAVIEAALRSGVDAIHPGYGFLSEDPDFAEVCEENGITFIGPRPELMALIGDKSAARSVFGGAGLPLLPGSRLRLGGVEEALALGATVGYPLLLKACAGGGGRGLGVVHSAADLAPTFERTSAQALNVFGDGGLYAERLVTSARHVEVQVVADKQGNCLSLGERDCSVQRRYQKLVEESPAPGIDPELTEEMCAAAARAVAAIGYEGVGTLEFLVTPEGTWHFMEMNCRIQVEHPVTEMITGIDIVREQLLVSSGVPMSVQRQDEVSRNGVAVECRVNTEDPARDFLPTPGRIEKLVLPAGPFTRVDTHARVGTTISPDYDPLLAKVVVWAPTREQALARMDRALAEVEVDGPGICTNTSFLRSVLRNENFRKARHSTSLIEEMRGEP